MRTTVPPERATAPPDLTSPHANAIVALPAWRSPTVIVGALIGGLSALLPFLPPPWDTRDKTAIGVLTAVAIFLGRLLALDAGQQGANRAPGDFGPKVRDALPSGGGEAKPGDTP